MENPGVDWRIILKWIFKKQDGGVDWIDLAQDGDNVVGSGGHGNESSGYVKCEEFLF